MSTGKAHRTHVDSPPRCAIDLSINAQNSGEQPAMGIRAVFFDMDDTLVLTGEADVRAYREVMQLARQRKEQVQPCTGWPHDT